jgi:hypothetical protein
MKRKKSLREMWHRINEPKVESTGFIFDENGQPIVKYEIVDRIPPIRRQRRKQK